MTKWILALCLAAAPVQAQDTAQWYPFSLPCGPVEPLFKLLAEKEEYLLNDGRQFLGRLFLKIQHDAN